MDHIERQSAQVRLRKLERLFPLLPNMCPPLQNIVGHSQYTQYISWSWYYASLSAIYTKQDRDFANFIKQAGQDLLRQFMIADLNLICRDERVKASKTRGFYRAKYGLQSGEISRILGKSLGQLMSNLDKSERRKGLQFMTRIADKTISPKKPSIYSHFHRHGDDRRQIGCSDNLLKDLLQPVPEIRAREQQAAEPPHAPSKATEPQEIPHTQEGKQKASQSPTA